MDGAERTACSASKTTGGGTGPRGPKSCEIGDFVGGWLEQLRRWLGS